MATNNSVNSPLSGTSGTGNFTGNNSPTLTTPKINQINDTSGNGALLFNVTGSAVNFFNMTNATTGNNCVFGTSGSDSNISMRIQPKGTGYVEVYTLASTGQIQWVSGDGSNYTHRSIHNLPTTAATTNYTWPDLSGTVALSGASQNVSFNVVQPAQINDTNNNQIIGFLPIANAVNTLQIGNANAGGQININTAGSDSNINMVLQPKGTGYLRYYTQATANQITVNTGTSYVHETLFQFPNTSASRSVTFPDATGTVALSGASQDVTFNSISWSDTTKGIVGTTTNNNASAGYVGEFISSEILSSSFITLTIGAVTNVTSITLTAGDWDVWGNIALQFTNNNGDYAFGAINTTSATLVDASLMSGYQYGAITTGYWRFTVPYKRISVSSNTTTYLVVQAGGTGTVYAGGAIYARRVR